MGLLDALNGLTDKMNELADRVPLGAQQAGVQPSGVQGLGGLGNINTDNANGQLESPLNQVHKIDADSRKLATNMERFGSIIDYKKYLIDWLSNTGVCSVEFNGDYIAVSVNQQTNNQMTTSSFEIYPVLNFNEVNNIITLMSQIPVSQTAMPQGPMPQGPISTTSKVIIGYMNYSNEQIKFAKQSSIELVGANEILEINSAIDLGLKKMPYVTLDKKSFTHLFGSLLNRKYSDNTMGNGIGATFSQVTQNINNSMQNIGDNLSGQSNVSDKSEQTEVISTEMANTPVVDDTQTKTTVSLEKVPEDTINKEGGVSLKKED